MPSISHLVPSDEGWQADKAFLAELTPVIAQLSKYVMSYFDADAGRAEPISVEDERTLSQRVAFIAANMQARADRREALGEQPPVVKGNAESSLQITDGGQR